ncbi:MAG: PIN domain-containing protein [Agitococcus sp.]|nr:PIN domain-containing protein [Agitococcus sp.]
MTVYVLDACAVLAYINNEIGADKVEQLLMSRQTVFMASINVLEICYDMARRTGDLEEASNFYRLITSWPIHIVDVLDEPLLMAAASFKMRGRLSLADAVALGLSKIKQAKLVTSDHHEFDTLEQAGLAEFEWIR